MLKRICANVTQQIKHFCKVSYDTIIEILLPASCSFCFCSVENANGCCVKCWSKVNFLGTGVCKICGYPIYTEGDIQELHCGQCLRYQVSFDKSRSVSIYSDVTISLISELKYFDKLQNARTMGYMMFSLYSQEFHDTDIITVTPMHSKSFRKRLYNQSCLISLALMRRISSYGKTVPLFIPDLLIKYRQTARQATLSRNGRLYNVKHSVKLNPKYSHLKGKKILIIDDVITTGATINECSKVIKKTLTDSTVYCLSFARSILSTY